MPIAYFYRKCNKAVKIKENINSNRHDALEDNGVYKKCEDKTELET